MKKSLLKKLSLMARDGDPEAIEALAEAVEEIVESPSAEPGSTVAIAAQAEPEPVPAAPAAESESPAAAADTDPLSAILERLDQMIALLTPAVPAADSDPDPLPEQMAEIVEETVEAVESAEPETAPAEEIAAAVTEFIDPAVSTVLEPDDAEEETADGCTLPLETADALRAAMKVIRPALKRMTCKERREACADIAANLKKIGMDNAAYAALITARNRQSANPADLGKRIMASRNPNYK